MNESTDEAIVEQALEDAHAGDAECQCFVGINHLYGWDGFERNLTCQRRSENVRRRPV